MVKQTSSRFLEFIDRTSTLTQSSISSPHDFASALNEGWAFDWFDLEVPIQFGSMFILPTCLYVVHRHTRMLLGHEFVRELDQRRVELFLHRAFQEKGAPDELLVPDLDEWDESVWQSFSKEYQCQINLIDVESNEVEGGERGG